MTVLPLTEAQWQEQVTDLAELHGWTWAHFRSAQTAKGWRTPVSGPLGAGFPDLVIVRERVIFVELKTEQGRVSEAQEVVIAALEDASAEAYVFRPSDFDFARFVLAGNRPTTRNGPAAEKRPGPGQPLPGGTAMPDLIPSPGGAA